MDGATVSSQTFRTPSRILIPKLVDSRDGWKAKAAERKKKLKAARIRIRDLEVSRDGWKRKNGDTENRNAELQRQLAQAQQDVATLRDENERLRDEAKKKTAAVELSPPAKGGQFSVTVVQLAVDLVRQVGVSMRGAAAGLALMASRLGLDIEMPSFGAVRSWLLRLGCYALTCALPTGDWVLLLDHTVQIGPCKLLVIVGCPLASVPFGERPLRHSDLHLVGMSLMEHSTDKTVAAELEKARERVGAVCQCVSDGGSDVSGGVKLFQQKQAGVAHVHDMAHVAAIWLKQIRGRDTKWTDFVAKLAQAGAKVRQTRDAHLRPPTVRAKARFMNVGPTLRFAGRVLRLLDKGEPSARVRENYAWLDEYRQEIANWQNEQAVVDMTLEYVRTHGIGLDAERQLDAAWLPMQLTPGSGAYDLATRLRTAVRNESVQAKPGEKLVASTEVLESIFGKLKRLEGDYANDGFTGLTATLGAFLGEQTEEQTQKALEAVPKKEAESWVKKVVGTTVQMFRRLFVNTGKA